MAELEKVVCEACHTTVGYDLAGYKIPACAECYARRHYAVEVVIPRRSGYDKLERSVPMSKAEANAMVREWSAVGIKATVIDLNRATPADTKRKRRLKAVR